MKVVAFGELLLRLDTRGHERFVQAGEFLARYTGGEANVAVALAGWGHETFAVSKVPAHEIGQSCVDALRRHGVNTDGIVRGGDRLGILFVETGASQRATRVIYDRQHTSFRDARPSEFDWEAILAGKDWLHFTGTAPALGASVLESLRSALATARRLAIPVSFDCNFRSTLWSQAEAREVLPALMGDVAVFVGSEHDAAALFDIGGSPSESAAALRRRFGFRCVAYTLRQGESASVNRLSGLVCDASGCRTSREYTMHVVDRVGGGDAFTAGLLHGLASGWDAQRVVEFAAAASCLKHTIPGDFNLVSLDEVEQLVTRGEAGPVRR
jgi:2-dehydro-3-deoxygluconokinase